MRTLAPSAIRRAAGLLLALMFALSIGSTTAVARVSPAAQELSAVGIFPPPPQCGDSFRITNQYRLDSTHVELRIVGVDLRRWFTGYGLAVVGWDDRSGNHVEKHNASSYSGSNFTIELHLGPIDKKGTVYVALTDADNRVTYCQKVFYVTITV
ncbi:hypothetical protein [Kribbella deserti]|uniref:Secreted protein n=1 Tax=Kribbella deserti TaxID=1926257 RepID=A0ABV6QGC7_9ACTN